MPKLALFINSLNKGGAERVASNLADYLVDAGWELVLVTQYRRAEEYPLRHKGEIRRILSEPGEGQGALTGAKDLQPAQDGTENAPGRRGQDAQDRGESTSGRRAPYSRYCQSNLPGAAGRAVNFLRRWRKLRAIWKAERPDLILSFIGKNNVMALSSARGLGIPVVVCVRSDPAREYADAALRRQAFRLFRRAAGVVLQTTDGRKFFPPAIAERSVILPNPLHPAFCGALWTGERDHRIVSVGRIDENKHQSLMIDAFEALATAFPSWQLVFYGDGPARAGLETRVREDGMEDRIVFEGAVPDVADRIRSASMFLLTSDREGMPNALLEAMALGIPCISTDCPCGGPRDVIQSGENGLLVPVGDAQALEQAMRVLLEEPDRAARMGEEAARIRERCGPEQALSLWEQYLRTRIGA